MTTGMTTSRQLAYAAVLLLMAAGLTATAQAQNIYKCTQSGQVSYTDVPCLGNQGKLLYQADDADIIDQYLRLGEDVRARNYARAHHLDALYTERLAAYQQTMQERAQREEAEAAAAQQRAEQAQQQALADAAADSAELRAQNQLLRQQNNQYQDQLAQPGYDAAPVYWNSLPPYWSRQGGHGGGHGKPPPKEPIFHPCTQLAGGRVTC